MRSPGAPAGPATASIPAERSAGGALRGNTAAMPAAGALRDGATRGTEAPLREAVAAPTAPADAELAVHVHDGATRPLGAARVWLCDSTWCEGQKPSAAFALADAAGIARLAARPELDTILVLAQGRRPIQVARAPGPEQQVVVDQPLSITGTVVVDGQRPVAPIDLVATCPNPPSARWCAAALAALAPFDPKESAAAATCDANGRFAFFGLTPGVEHRVKPRVRAWKRPGTVRSEPSVKATPLAVDVVLELASMPVITGRVVLPEGVSAEGRERVWIVPRFVASNGDWSEYGGYPCRIGESFTVPVETPDFGADLATTTLEFRLGPTKANPIAATRSVACPFTGTHDLGDVVLDDRSTQNELIVVDRRDTGVAGARVLSFDRLSAPAEADGRVRARVPPAPGRIVVGAKGYRARAIDVTDGMQWPLRVVLEEANQLRVEARAAGSATKLAPLRVNLVFADRPDDHDLGDSFRVNELRGSKPIAMGASGDVVTFYFEMPPAGAFELCDLPPGVGFTVQLCDAFGHEIASEAVVLRDDERRDVRFVVSPLPRRLAGQVVDAEGRPLRGVLVSVGPNDWDPRSTDAEGRFAVDGVYADSPMLQFDQDGFRQLIVHGAELFDRTSYRLERAN